MPVPFVPFLDVMQVNIRYLLDNQKIENVIHFSYLGSDFQDAASQVSGMIQNELWPLLRPHTTDKLTFKEIYCVDQSSNDGPVATFPITLNTQGTALVDTLPNSAAFCLTFRTAKRGKSYTGRVYVPAIPEHSTGGSYVGQNYATGVTDAWENLRSVAGASGLPLVVASRIHNKVYRTLGIAEPVTAVVARDNVIDSQRRRTPGRGS